MTDDKPQETDRTERRDTEPHHLKLRDLFVAATDVGKVTETQDERANSPILSDEESVSVSEAVDGFVKADGLTDTYADPAFESDDG